MEHESPSSPKVHDANQEKGLEEQVDFLLKNWSTFSEKERKGAFFKMSRVNAEELFLNLTSSDQAEIFQEIFPAKRRSWMRLLAPDDAVDLIQAMSTQEQREECLLLLDDQTRKEVQALLFYEEDNAGGLMSSRFARLRPEMSVDEAILYLRAQAKTQVETIYYAYVLDLEQRLLGAVSFRELFSANGDRKVHEIMETDLIQIPETMDQEEVGRLFAQNDLMAIPVVDEANRIKGIVTVDDVVTVVQEEATEDIQKLGGVEALEAPYLQTAFLEMIKKRAGWLMILFAGELLTASAMGFFENEIEKAVVLALFIPLIISSGGNSGSQASTLIIRALALDEVRIKDWSRVLKREIYSGLVLGGILGAMGFVRILLWPNREQLYTQHYQMVAITVSVSLLGTVLWGTVTGSMLPFVLKKLNFDPATASAPFVATMVDVTGLVIYFLTASLMLKGLLL